MRLSDIMSGLQLSSYAEIAMLIFLGAFVAVTLSLFIGTRATEWERYSRLPLELPEELPSPAKAAESDPPGVSTP
jgi:hypothetical protein